MASRQSFVFAVSLFVFVVFVLCPHLAFALSPRETQPLEEDEVLLSGQQDALPIVDVFNVRRFVSLEKNQFSLILVFAVGPTSVLAIAFVIFIFDLAWFLGHCLAPPSAALPAALRTVQTMRALAPFSIFAFSIQLRLAALHKLASLPNLTNN
jgi:hypothetical protein